MPLPDVYEEEFFSNAEIIAGNVKSLANVIVKYNTAPIILTANILEQVNVVIGYGVVEASNTGILFTGAYSNIFTDKIIQYRKTGNDPTVYRVFSFGSIEDNLYALTRYRPDLRNELSVEYTFISEVVDPDTGGVSNSNVTITQILLNNYDTGIRQMLAKIRNETKIKGQV